MYSDSAFWMHAATANKLVRMAEEAGVLDTESCIYGDFLTCLGQRSDKYHVVKLYKELNNNKETHVTITPPPLTPSPPRRITRAKAKQKAKIKNLID